ncbi:hypothetical protein HPGCJGGD_4247 [Methylobacterium haplocladii]|nr:hypothetical protein HPGCJGGD_4247 [Methylobacterium haplocladii]
MASTFGEACQPFVDAGIPARALLPIAPLGAKLLKASDLKEDSLGKSPGRFNKAKGQWGGLGFDPIKVGRGQDDIAEMAPWPTPNVGILGRYLPAIDSDAENEDARRLIEKAVISTFGQHAEIAERRRGTVARRLYAFRAKDPDDHDGVVRGRHIAYRLKGETEADLVHKLDIIGFGNQFVAAGNHASGTHYEWAPNWRLTDLHRACRKNDPTVGLLRIENADIVRFIAEFEHMLTEAGGEILRASGGRVPGEERDFSKEEPLYPVADVLKGLDQIPNCKDLFPHRDDLVRTVSAIRAALGAEAEPHYDNIREWATANPDPDWCPDEYFEKVWNSLDRGVRVDREALDRIFRRNKVFVSAKLEFTGNTDAMMKGTRERKLEARAKEMDILEEISARYVFGHVNTRTGDGALRMRSSWNPAVEWRVEDWWEGKTTDNALALLDRLQEGGRYDSDEHGMWSFARDMVKLYPNVFYTGETRHPNIERGEIVVFANPYGEPTREINMRFLSPVIRAAAAPPKDPRQASEDLNRVLDFVGRVFGKFAKYELDTLAYMVQTGRRPGHMLFLVGEQGVGKSIYAHMLISMFDGIGKDMGAQIDGTKMTNEAARRFALARVEGARIISVKELPEGSTATNMAAVTSSLKQLVDPGPDGDYFQIEAKGKDSRPVLNHARVVTTSNYANSLKIETYDRRIFFIRCGIDLENKPEPEYYADLTDITGDPLRLATFWRHLRERDVSGYEVAKAPPVSVEKLEAEISGMTDPWERHMAAALETLRAANRELFDLKELAGLMTDMAENEHANTNGTVDDRREYNFGNNPAASKRLAREATKIKEIRSNGKCLGNVYGFRTARQIIDRFKIASNRAVLEALDQDRAKPLSRVHVFPIFAGPLRSTGRQ